MTLKLDSKLTNDTAVLICQGDLVGGAEAAELRNAVTELLRKREHVVLDLSGVSYMNSGGLGSLVGLYSTARTCGGSIKYVNLSVPIEFSKRQGPAKVAA